MEPATDSSSSLGALYLPFSRLECVTSSRRGTCPPHLSLWLQLDAVSRVRSMRSSMKWSWNVFNLN